MAGLQDITPISESFMVIKERLGAGTRGGKGCLASCVSASDHQYLRHVFHVKHSYFPMQ